MSGRRGRGAHTLEAPPLHVADEEESLVPRLRGREPELDAALERTAAEHRRHEPPLADEVRARRRRAWQR